MVSKNWILRNPTFKVRIFTLKTQNQQKLELGMNKVWLGYYIPSLILFWKTKRDFKEWVSMRKIRRWLLENKCNLKEVADEEDGFCNKFTWLFLLVSVSLGGPVNYEDSFFLFFHLRIIKKKFKYTYIRLLVISKHH